MTWHEARSLTPILCGRCASPIRRAPAEAPPVWYATVTIAKLIRCRPCAEAMRAAIEDARGVCAWPRLEPAEDRLVVPAPLLPGIALRPTTQPFHPVRAVVRDYKAAQLSEADQ